MYSWIINDSSAQDKTNAERGHLVRLSAQRELFRKGILIDEKLERTAPAG